MPNDFRSSQIQIKQIISSGSLASGTGAKLVIYPIEAQGSPNNTGIINQSIFNTSSLNGRDIFLFVSGGINERGTNNRSISVFGGDLHVSGNLTFGGGSIAGNQWIEGSPSPRLRTTASVAIGSSTVWAQDKDPSAIFYVSGNLYENTKKVVIDSFVHISNSLALGQDHLYETIQSDSTIIAGYADIISGTNDSSIIVGSNNKVNNVSSFGTVGFANDSNGVSSMLVVGSNNQVALTDTGMVVGGFNSLSASAYAGIIGGVGNKIEEYSNASSIIGGISNTISGNSNDSQPTIGTVISSYTASINSSVYSTIQSSDGSNISGSFGSSVISDISSTIRNHSTASSILASVSSLINNSKYSLLAANNLGLINNSQYSAVVGGYLNAITNSNYSVVEGGYQNTISSSDYSTIAGGYNGSIKNSTMSTIINGSNNSLIGVNYSSIVGGIFHQLSASSESVLVGGVINRITRSNESAIIGNTRTLIVDSFRTIAIGSEISTLYYQSSSGIYSVYSASIINLSSTPGLSNAIFGGVTGSIRNSTYSQMFGGISNTIGESTSESHIFGGSRNSILTSSVGSQIVGGYSNKVTGSGYGVVLGGQQNIIYGSQNSGIALSIGDKIDSNSYYASAFGNYASTLTDVLKSSILNSENSQILSNDRSAIYSSQLSTITGSGYGTGEGHVKNDRNIIVGGYSHSVKNSFYSLLLGGNTNEINSSSYSSTFVGSTNIISESSNATINNSDNSVIVKSTYSSIFNSLFGYVSGSQRTVDVSSEGSSFYNQYIAGIYSSNNSTIAQNNPLEIGNGNIILGGNNNTIQESQFSQILGGDSVNSINNCSSSIIIGSGLTLTNSLGEILLGGRVDTNNLLYPASAQNYPYKVTISASRGLHMHSGSIYAWNGLSGSLQRTVNGNPYIIGNGITVNTNSLGQIELTGSAGVTLPTRQFIAAMNTTTTTASNLQTLGSAYFVPSEHNSTTWYLKTILAANAITNTAYVRLYNITSGAYVEIGGTGVTALSTSNTTPTVLSSSNLKTAVNFNPSTASIYELRFYGSGSTPITTHYGAEIVCY